LYIHFIIDKGSYNDQINLQGESRIILVIEKMVIVSAVDIGGIVGHNSLNCVFIILMGAGVDF
jgi:hypothetical protein